jgi:hypothetical protein
MIGGGAAAPSIAETMGLAEVEDGGAVFARAPSDRLLNPLGAGYCPRPLCAYLDRELRWRRRAPMPPAGAGAPTVETKVNFVRAITPKTGPVRAERRVVARRRASITAEIRDATGALLAHGASTLLVLRRRPHSEGKTQ